VSQNAGNSLGHPGGTALHRRAHLRLELESVSVFNEDSEHRGGMQMIEVLGRQKVAQPDVGRLVFASELTQVRGGLLRNAIEGSRE
jgi:hypothetical protein